MAINLSKENTKKSSEISYEVFEECGTLDTKTYTQKGEEITDNLKLRYMSWNDGTPRYDLRWWTETSEGERCGKGVGFSGEALIELGKLIQKLQEEKPKKTVACKSKKSYTTTQKKK